jgi:hypothetical protein
MKTTMYSHAYPTKCLYPMERNVFPTWKYDFDELFILKTILSKVLP